MTPALLQERPYRFLGLDYAPDVAPRLLEAMERAGKRTGISLEHMELLGQTETAARDFVHAVEAGEEDEFLDHIYWDTLAEVRAARG